MAAADAEAPADAAAGLLERLAVLLGAGVEPTSAVGLLAARSRGGIRSRLESAALALQRGESPAPALAVPAAESARPDAAAWCAVAAAWTVAIEVGAPLGPALSGIAGVLREQAERARAVRAELAGPAASARVLLLLPPAGLLLCTLLGIEVLPFLFGTGLGWGLAAAAAALVWLARRWTRSLLHAASPSEAVPALDLELVAIALAGGIGVGAARARAHAAMQRCGVPAADDPALGAALELAAAAGAPAAVLLQAEAARVRAEVRLADRERIARLGVRLLAPLGVCALPAFVLSTVLPAVAGILAATVRSF